MGTISSENREDISFLINKYRAKNNSQLREDGTSLICFSLANWVFGFNANQVQMILGPQNLYEVRLVPSHILGVFSYKGSAVAIVDLYQILGIDGGDVANNSVGEKNLERIK